MRILRKLRSCVIVPSPPPGIRCPQALSFLVTWELGLGLPSLKVYGYSYLGDLLICIECSLGAGPRSGCLVRHIPILICRVVRTLGPEVLESWLSLY